MEGSISGFVNEARRMSAYRVRIRCATHSRALSRTWNLRFIRSPFLSLVVGYSTISPLEHIPGRLGTADATREHEHVRTGAMGRQTMNLPLAWTVLLALLTAAATERRMQIDPQLEALTPSSTVPVTPIHVCIHPFSPPDCLRAQHQRTAIHISSGYPVNSIEQDRRPESVAIILVVTVISKTEKEALAQFTS